MEKDQHKASIYLLVGFLGAGKTTFIKKLLQRPNSDRFAVIQNEFAEEMGFEAPLIMNAEGTPFQNFMELPNGCICCSAKNDLLAAVEYLVNVSGIRSIVVETNGVADPANSIKQFWLDSELEIPVRLHSIICIVPTHRIESVSTDELFRKQLIYSNKVILNFLDKSTVDQKARALELIHQVNPLLRVLESPDPNLYDIIFQGQFFSINDVIDFKAPKEPHHPHFEIESVVIKGKIYEDPRIFERNVGTLLWENEKAKVLRIKGIVVFQHQEYVFEIQGVDDTFELRKSSLLKTALECGSKILVIGKGLQAEDIGKQLQEQKM